MNYEVVHTTEYLYEGTISLCHNIARLMPRSTATQFCKKTNVHISPQPDAVNEYTDFFGNKVLYFAIQQEHKKLIVTVSSLISKITLLRKIIIIILSVGKTPGSSIWPRYRSGWN